ncbi:putative alpha-ketoglutarate-dependent sulfonate dioxygenase [Lachnellula suecica]|uniref:Putative alpha-ketoglutarate-dependent sulfonate dioxygenase n=1 Tax=Lachnellula suecica TaxID=602035 RepID=A0A8T9C9B1_9HELO|nr:putative alpha-ketoglutarate-dependent sulfonate dioxygenase [Lachnellula suecica]
MAPSADIPVDSHLPKDPNATKSRNTAPLKKSGVLDAAFEFDDVTPTIGREYGTAKIVEDILNAPNSDELLRDLAITISERGVVFFRKQDSLTNDLQKQFILRLGELTGRPTSSTVHIHPILNNTQENSALDAEISTISSAYRKKKYFIDDRKSLRKNTRKTEASWHSDIQFEEVPADYTSLRIVQKPSNGGDTLWASGYDIYDRFSKPYQKLFDSLTVNFVGEGFLKAAADGKVTLYDKARGSPENVGTHLSAVHPLVRTNPVTGWKSIFGIGNFPKYINELDPEESDELLAKFYHVILDNHDVQVRFKWKNENDIAIWDNRSVFHSATFDYEGLGERAGNRVVGIGEKPYFDPNSKSKAEALAEASV